MALLRDNLFIRVLFHTYGEFSKLKEKECIKFILVI